MTGEEGDQAVRGRDISADGVGGAAALAREMIMPARRDECRAMLG